MRMKKIFTLIAAALMSMSMNAADTVALDLSDLGSGWSSSYDATTQTITYESAWAGRGWWLGGKDLYSSYESVVLEFEATPMAVQIVVENFGDDGSTINQDLTGKTYVEAGSTSVSFTFTENEKNCAQIYLQAAETGSVKLTKAYYVVKGTGEETGDVSTVDINLTGWYGWGGETITNNEDGTMTVEYVKDWGGAAAWLGEFDASAYDFLGMEIEPATIATQLWLQYADDTNGSSYLDAGGTTTKVDLDVDKKNSIKQICVQNATPGTVVIKRVYWGKNTTGISQIESAQKTLNSAVYNVAGQRVNNSYKGLVIKNGKKYLVK